MSSNGSWKDLVKVTAQQEEALTSLSPLTVVSAGAGTGKTQTLAYRYAWLLAQDDDCGVEDILVLTFTKKAAREMQERIKATLGDWGDKMPCRYGRLKSCALAIEDGYISTIHSFAMKMIREAGLELDIDPTSSVMPAPKEDIWWAGFAELLSDSSFDRIKEGLPENWKGRADELAAEKHILDAVNGFGPENLAAAAKSCSDKLYCAGQSADSLWNHTDTELMNSIDGMAIKRKAVFDEWQKNVIPAVMAFPRPSGSNKFYDTVFTFAEYWRGAEPAEENIDLFAKGLLEEALSRIPSKGDFKECMTDAVGMKLTEYKSLLKQDAELSRVPSESERALSRLLCRICAAGWASWDEFRKRERLLTLSDLIYYAAKLLGSSPDYKRKFKHILVDEFQDTDPQQNELIRSLWNDPEKPSDCSNTLFLVGDQKQSIYRFRHADLTLFGSYIARCMESVPEKCRYVPLDQNFRTSEPLLDKFNTIFEPLWTENDDGIRYERLNPPADAEFCKKRNGEAAPPHLEMLTATAPYEETAESSENTEKVNAEELRERLYTSLGKQFAKMRADQIRIWNKKTQSREPAKWRDFAVLVPSRAQYGPIERAFDALGLPYILTTNKSYFGRSEVTDLVNLTALLASPYDPMYLGGWLASPFSGLTYDEAGELLAEALQRKTPGRPLPLTDILSEKRPDLCAMLDSMRRTALLDGVSALILELLKRPFFLEHYYGIRRRRVNANIIYLAELAAEYELSQGKSLLGCADYLRGAVSQEGAKEEPDIADENTDAVRIMTIHASKGLEFPVVALCWSDGNTGNNSSSLLISKKYGVISTKTPQTMTAGGKEEKTAAALWEKYEEGKAEVAQKRRIAYVGVTRAQDRLILCSIYKESKNDAKDGRKKSFLSDIADSGAADRITELTTKEHVSAKTSAPEKLPTAPTLKLKETVPARLAKLSASAFALLSWCPAAYRMVYRQGRTVDWTVKGGEGEGSVFGSLTHWILARWDFRKETLQQLLPEKNKADGFRTALLKVPPALQEEFASQAKRAEISAMLARYSDTEEGADFAAMAAKESAVKLWREMPFRVPENEIVLVGATDIYWHDTDGLHLRDWKSSEEAYAPSLYYESQLDFYAYALSRYYNNKETAAALPIDSAIIYLRSTDSGRRVRRYDEADFSKIKERIYSCAEAALSQNIIVPKERCAFCPWKKECRRQFCSKE